MLNVILQVSIITFFCLCPNWIATFCFSFCVWALKRACTHATEWVNSMICLQRYYIPSARELARLCGVCKGPLIQHFSETLLGSSTIRSFDQEPRFRDLNMRLVDAYSRPKFYTSGAMEWLCFRMDVLCLLTFGFSLVFLIFIPEGTIDPSECG